MRECVFSVCARCLFVVCLSFHLSGQTRIKRELLDDNVQSYLMKFGYIEDRGDVAAAYRTEDSIRDAIRDMQRFAGLPVSGILDEATDKLMRTPRCGMPDDVKQNNWNSRRTKRFAVHGAKWPKTDLTWSLRSWGNLNKENVTHVIGKALQVWSKHSKLEFRNVDEHQRADILIYFFSRDHGDRFPFDGKGVVLAHAFFPSGTGSSVDVHFDADEAWVTGGVTEPGSTNLFNVAAHEIGHSLGLGHSSVDNALMYPWYKEITDGFDYELPEDDRNGIQSLYGRRDINTRVWDKIPSYNPPPQRPITTTPRPRTRYTPRPHIPYNPYHGHHHPTVKSYYPQKPIPPEKKPYYPKPDAGSGYPDRRYYPTKHHHHHHNPPDQYPTRHNNPKPETPAPRPDRPPERPPTRHHPAKESPLPPPNTCDTSYDAVSMIRREVFIFKDAYFWRIGDHGLKNGYPALIHRLWYDLPKDLTHVDAVYENSDGKIVFFIGKLYYVFTGQRLERGFPRPLTDLGLPEDLEKIDGAMVWGHNSQTYFYSGNMYWRLDETVGKVELDYPRNMAMWKGVGTDIDAVFQWRDGKTYFFKGKGFWKFNDNRMRVEHPEQKPSAPFWMGCSDNFEDNEVLEKLPYKEASKAAVNILNTSVLLVFLVSILNTYLY